MAGKETVEQTKLAFDFIEKLYFETSYLIKEIEGILRQESEEFVIGKTGGYQIVAKSSNGLDYVNQWLMRKLAVFFCPRAMTKVERGMTNTPITNELKVIYVRIILSGENVTEPQIWSGPLYNMAVKNEKYFKKFENVMGFLEYNEDRVFQTIANIDYEDPNIKFMGKLLINHLYDITDSDELVAKIIRPALEEFRQLQHMA